MRCAASVRADASRQYTARDICIRHCRMYLPAADLPLTVAVLLTALGPSAVNGQANPDAFAATCPAGPTALGCYHDHDPSFNKPEFVGPRVLPWGAPGCSGWGGCGSPQHGRTDCKPWPEGAERSVPAAI